MIDLDDAISAMWQAVGRSSQTEIAEQIGVAPSTLTRWRGGITPEGKARAKVLAWAEAQPSEPEPLPPVEVPADYWRGVLYAAEAMSETVTRLLREARETGERLNYMSKPDRPRMAAEPKPVAFGGKKDETSQPVDREGALESSELSADRAGRSQGESAAPRRRRKQG